LELWLLKYSQNSGDCVELVFSKDTTTRKKSAVVLQGCQYAIETKRYTTIETSRNHVCFTPTKKIAEQTVKIHPRCTAINAKQKKFFEHRYRWWRIPMRKMLSNQIFIWNCGC